MQSSTPTVDRRLPPAEAWDRLTINGHRDEEKASRLESVDLVRGVVMLVMGLDHTREFFTNVRFQPEDLTRSFPALFFTRWITHFCAPAFFFLAGIGGFLSLTRGKSVTELSAFLWRRGVWIVVLELTLVDFIFTFSWRYPIGVVLWALGWSMIVLAAIVRLRIGIIAALSVAIIALHNAFDNLQAHDALLQVVVNVLHRPFITVLPDGIVTGALYPLAPWVGVMALGYASGYAYTVPKKLRNWAFVSGGVGLCVGFVVLRATNWYGDPRLWRHQASALMTLCSFLNCTKYPPSLCFVLMTLGPLLIALAVAERRIPRKLRPVLIYGRVPLFFYVGHLLLLHVLAVLVAVGTRQPVAWLFHGAVLGSIPSDYGHSLGVVYLVWAAAMLLMYPVCVWFAGVKSESGNPLLSYF